MRWPRSRRRLALGVGALLLMGLLLLAYALLHLSVRRVIWDALFGGDCTMFCGTLRVSAEIAQAVSATWLIGVAIIAAVPLAGALVRTGLERIVAAGLIAYGLIAIPAAIVGYAGDLVGTHLLKPPVGPLLASLPSVLAIGVFVARGWRPSWPRGETGVRLTPAIAILLALVVAATIVQLGIAVHRPFTGFDALGYHAPLAVLFWHDGGIASFLDRFAASAVLNHPGGTELWQGLLLLIGGEPLAMGGQLPFALLGGAGVALFGRRLGLRNGAAVLAGLLFLLAPMVTEQMGHLRNDVVGSSLVVVTAAILADRTPGTLPSRLILGCLGLGLMMVTKLSLLPAVGALSLVVLWLLIHEIRSGRPMGPVWKAFGIGVAVALLAVAPWWIRNLLDHGNPLYPLNFPIVGGGVPWASPPDSRYVPSPLLWPIYPLIEPYGPANGFGGAYAVGIIPGLVAALFLARRRPLAMLGLMLVITIPAWVLLDRREPRFLLGVVGLSFALIPFALVALRRRGRGWAVGFLVAASVVTVAAQWMVTTPRYAEERIAFYDQAWGVDPVADALPETVGILVDDRCGGPEGRLYPWFGAGQKRRVARVGCKGTSAEDVLRLMREERLSHVALFVPEADGAARIATLYPPEAFTEVSRSIRTSDKGTRLRVLLRWNGAPVDPADDDGSPGADASPGADIPPGD